MRQVGRIMMTMRIVVGSIMGMARVSGVRIAMLVGGMILGVSGRGRRLIVSPRHGHGRQRHQQAAQPTGYRTSHHHDDNLAHRVTNASQQHGAAVLLDLAKPVTAACR